MQSSFHYIFNSLYIITRDALRAARDKKWVAYLFHGSRKWYIMNELIEPGLNLIKTCPPPRLEGIFLSSVVVIVFNKNGPIRIHYLRVCLWVLLGLRHKEFVVLRSVKYLKYVRTAISSFDFKSVVCHL